MEEFIKNFANQPAQIVGEFKDYLALVGLHSTTGFIPTGAPQQPPNVR